jgi:signal transduction histidine kinase
MPSEIQDTVLYYTIIAFFMPIVLFGALLGFIILFQKRKHQHELLRRDSVLREQALIIEKQLAIEHERTRIASEMHDDLGSGLTTIRYLSDKALKQAKDSEEAEQIKRISEHSNLLVRNMSEIIWAMNSRYDNAENLVGYFRRYASEYLTEHEINLQFETNEYDLDKVEVSGEKRRNLFLVFKEVLHNAVKYSGTHKISIIFETSENIQIKVSEVDGKGFKVDKSVEKGNGLFNCEKRMTSIGGSILFEQTGHGIDVIFSAPLRT